jgi:hypothetical protein
VRDQHLGLGGEDRERLQQLLELAVDRNEDASEAARADLWSEFGIAFKPNTKF